MDRGSPPQDRSAEYCARPSPLHVPHCRAPPAARHAPWGAASRSEEHTSELQSLMRISYAVFCLKKKNIQTTTNNTTTLQTKIKLIVIHNIKSTNQTRKN